MSMHKVESTTDALRYSQQRILHERLHLERKVQRLSSEVGDDKQPLDSYVARVKDTTPFRVFPYDPIKWSKQEHQDWRW